MREKEAYRDNLEYLMKFFPGKNILNVSDVAKFSGKDSRTVKKHYPFKNNEISVPSLARYLSYSAND